MRIPMGTNAHPLLLIYSCFLREKINAGSVWRKKIKPMVLKHLI